MTGEILKKKKGNDLSEVSGVHIIVIREPLKSSGSLWGHRRISEGLREPWKASIEAWRGRKTLRTIWEFLLSFLRVTERASLGLEDGWNDTKRSSRVLQDIGPFRAAALHCLNKNDKFTVYRYAMNTWVRVYRLYDWSWVPILREFEKWSKN